MPVPENELGPYITQTREKYSSSELQQFDPRLHALILDTIERGLRSLNQVPATDPFWHPSSMKPTVYKVGDYFVRILKAEPGDQQARWVLICSALRFGHQPEHFIGLMEPLLAADVRNIRWLMPGLLWLRQNGLYPICTPDSDPLLQVMARLARSRPDLRGRLETLRRDADQYVARSAEIALLVLNGAWSWSDSGYASFLECQSG